MSFSAAALRRRLRVARAIFEAAERCGVPVDPEGAGDLTCATLIAMDAIKAYEAEDVLA